MSKRGKQILSMALSINAQSTESQGSWVSPELDDSDDVVSDSGSEYLPNSNDSSRSSPFSNALNNRNIEENFYIESVENEIKNFNEEMDLETVNFEEQENSPPLDNLRIETVPTVKRRKRKHTCLFCYQEVRNFSRHLERNHFDEFEVQKFMALEKHSKDRKKYIDKLRKEGDFSTSNIVPVMKLEECSKNNYICCKFCRGYYTSKSLRRHVKKCFFNPDKSKRCNAQIDGQAIMVGNFGPQDPLKISGLLNMMRADEISLTAKKDKIICEVARRYIKSHREKHQLVVAKRYMRRLARLLMGVRQISHNKSLTLIDILTPHRFKDILKSTKLLAEYDEKERTFKSPSLALQMGTLIKNAINTAVSYEMQNDNDSSNERLQKLRSLNTLIETDWALEISSEAGQNLNINKFNKPSLIPIAEDVKKFECYLKDLIKKAKIGLAEDSSNVRGYRNLMEGIFCSLMIFNKRRVGELQRMTLLSFLKNCDKIPSTEFQKALTNSEKILYQSLKRIVIRGKRGRGVPVLFDKKTVESVEYLICIRKKFDLADNEFLFGIPGTKNPITGYQVMRKHAQLSIGDKQRALLLMSTKLRKQLATISQILNMEKNELEQLATFMGHTEKTHSQFYRLPDDIYQTAKVSKLLLLSKEGAIERFKGKSLEEIDIDFSVEESENEEGDEIPALNEVLEDNRHVLEEETNSADVVTNNQASCSKVKKGTKRTLVPWTSQQKTLTEKHFRNHIKKKIPPKKGEVMELIDKYPDVFHNKTYPTIKVYVCNKYRNK
ncbi:hypothetical protein FQR65_LT19551 [Abscondita terminalis]|nr:hypothetical protein FQR65_LT19551 [Abscondita terminalis]